MVLISAKLTNINDGLLLVSCLSGMYLLLKSDIFSDGLVSGISKLPADDMKSLMFSLGKIGSGCLTC